MSSQNEHKRKHVLDVLMTSAVRSPSFTGPDIIISRRDLRPSIIHVHSLLNKTASENGIRRARLEQDQNDCRDRRESDRICCLRKDLFDGGHTSDGKPDTTRQRKRLVRFAVSEVLQDMGGVQTPKILDQVHHWKRNPVAFMFVG